MGTRDVADFQSQHGGPLDPGDRFFSVPELAEYLSLSVSAIHKLSANGVLPRYKVGKRVYWRKREVDSWLLNHRLMSEEEIARAASQIASGGVNDRR